MQPEHRAMRVVGTTSTTRPSSSQHTPRTRVAFSPRIFESRVVARMGERLPFVPEQPQGTPLLRVHLLRPPSPISRYAAGPRIKLPVVSDPTVALPLNLSESPKRSGRSRRWRGTAARVPAPDALR